MSARWIRICGSAVVLTGVIAASAARVAGQDPAASDESPAVKFPDTWIGTTPPTPEALRGKAVLLYFFEETCPRCRGEWPALMALAAEHADDPIAFVAVNSGTPAAAVEAYARGVRLNWPIIVDLDRSFEQACAVNEVSLQNIKQVRYVSPTGQLKRGNWSDLQGTIERALEGAKWKVQPDTVPEALRPAWRSIEFARYDDAAPTVTKALKSSDRETKEAAQKLSRAVEEEARKELDEAKEAESKNKFRAHQLYQAIAERYAGFTFGSEAVAAARELAKDPQIKKELAAIKQIERQGNLLNSPKPSVRDRATAAIKKIIESQPDSEAARLGRELLGPN